MAIHFGDFGTRMPARRYDIPTAVTFLFAGLGLGSLLTLLLAPRHKSLGSFVRNPASVRPSPAL